MYAVHLLCPRQRFVLQIPECFGIRCPEVWPHSAGRGRLSFLCFRSPKPVWPLEVACAKKMKRDNGGYGFAENLGSHTGFRHCLCRASLGEEFMPHISEIGLFDYVAGKTDLTVQE